MDVVGEIRGLFESSERVTVVYHWDADGILSAITLTAYYGRGDRVYLEPPPFTFRVEEGFLDRLKASSSNSDLVVIVDLAYPGGTVDSIAESVGKPVVVIDHHEVDELPRSRRVVYYNPAAGGDPEGLYPSATHILAQVLGAYHPLLVAASIVGDLGEQAKANNVYQAYMVEAGLDPVRDYWLVEEAVRQLSSLEVMGKIDGVRWVPKVIGIGDMDPFKAIINDAFLTTLRAQAEEEFEALMSKAVEAVEEPAKGVVVVMLEGEGRHASRISRALASRFRDKVVIVAYYARSTGEARVYARTYKPFKPLTTLIPELRRRGYVAGGKYQGPVNVVALETTPERLEEAYREMIKLVLNLSRTN